MSTLSRYSLRRMEETDLLQVLTWRNSERVRSCMFTDQVITREEHFAWWERVKSQSLSAHLMFEEDGVPLGVVNFTKLDRQNGLCSWGFYIGAEDAPKGSGMRMGILALDYAFGAMGLRKVCAEVIGRNTPSLCYHQKLGFVTEGRLVDHVLHGGALEDVVLFALFSDEWSEAKPPLLLRYLLQGEAS